MSDYDHWLDKDLDEYYEDTEEDEIVDDNWKIDVFIEHEIEMENYYD